MTQLSFIEGIKSRVVYKNDYIPTILSEIVTEYDDAISPTSSLWASKLVNFYQSKGYLTDKQFEVFENIISGFNINREVIKSLIDTKYICSLN